MTSERRIILTSPPLRPFMPSTTITWTPDKLRRFEHTLAAATDDDAVITFEGNEFVVGYGRYLAEHLNNCFSHEATP